MDAVDAMHLGIGKTDSPFIAKMDADDICERNRLERQIRRIEENPSVVVCGTQAKLIDENDAEIDDRFFPCSVKAIKFRLLFQCPFLQRIYDAGFITTASQAR